VKNKPLVIGIGLATVALGLAAVKRQRVMRADHWNKKMASSISRTALVTGESSGIGEAYARRLASLGYDVILVARREERLKALASDLQQHFGIHTEVLAADLATPQGIDRVEKRIGELDRIDFLVNNAGFAIFGDFAEIPIEEQMGLINCHTIASVRFCRAVLPGMIARNRGAIVNVSSLGAFAPKPKDVTYCASKAYLNVFSEALQMELADTHIRVQVLCPGFTITEFHDIPQYAAYQLKKSIPRWLWMTSEAVVAESLKTLAEGGVVCIPGFKNRLIVAAARSGLTGFLLKLLRSFISKPERATLKRATLDLLACPTCHGDLILQDAAPSGDLASGSLVCSHCNKEYPIIDGIPRFIQYEELTGFNRSFAHLYDWFSHIYRLYSRVAFAFIGMTEDQGRHEILDRLEPKGGRVLEISIGPGVNLPYLVGAPGVSEVYGLDISLGQLKGCRSIIQSKGWYVDLFLGNAEELPFKDETFESVFHIGGINFFNDKKKAIEEMIRVAKPGTRIVIVDETERGARSYERTLPGFKRSFEGVRESISTPVDLVPPDMEDIRLGTVWQGWFYCLEFRKPVRKAIPTR
jgi:short-subunit dehydrogenase/uncharacterized protein YbaR (Trm112 family)/SAM-dependent methyltransferase